MSFQRYRELKALERPVPRPAEAVPARSSERKGNRNQQAARKQLTICQREIERLEETLKLVEAEMEKNACDYEKYSALYAQKEALDVQILEAMEKWERLAEEAGT